LRNRRGKQPAVRKERHTKSAHKKTDAAEHPLVVGDIGLPFNEPPDACQVALYLVFRRIQAIVRKGSARHRCFSSNVWILRFRSG
jgi:hypothetical protein